MKRLTACLAILTFLVPTQPAQALPYCAASETLDIGTVESGSYTNLCTINGTTEVLKEATDAGVSKLRVKWSFPDVGPGTIYLRYKGTRPQGSEDNYQFYWSSQGSNPSFGQLLTGAVIQNAFAPANGVEVYLETTTTTKTFTIFLADTDDTGTTLDTVTLDCVTVDDMNND